MRKGTCLLIVAVLLLFCVFFSLPWLAPVYVNSRLVPDLQKRYGLPGLSLTVGHLGLDGVIVQSLAFTDAEGRGIHVDSLSCTYSFFDLVVKREVQKCSIRGARVDLAESSEGGVTLAGLGPFLAGKRGGPEKEGEPDAAWRLPVTVKSLVFEKAHLSVLRSSGTMDIPLSFSVDLDRPLAASSTVPFRLQLQPFGQSGSVRGNIDFSGHGFSLQYGVQLDLASLPILLGLALPGQIGGKVDLAGEFAGSYAPFAVHRLAAEKRAFSPNGRYGDWQIGVLPSEAGSGPVTILSLQPDGSIRLTLPDLLVSGPVALAARAMELRFTPGSDELSASLSISPLAPVNLGTGGMLQLAGGLDISLLFNLKDATWTMSGASFPGEEKMKAAACTLHSGDGTTISTPFVMEFSGRGTTNSAAIRYTCSMPSAIINGAQVQGRVKGGLFKGDIALRKEKELFLADLDYSLQLPQVALADEAGVRGQGKFSINGKVRFDGRDTTGDGKLLFEKGFVELAEQQLAANGIAADIPFCWPRENEGNANSGHLTADAVNWRGKDLASLEVRLARQGGGYRYAGEILTKALDGALIKVSGRVDPVSTEGGPAFDGKLLLERHHFDTFSLKSIGLGQAVNVSGQVFADAHAAFKKGRLIAEATFGIEQGDIELPEQGITVSGVNTTLSFSELPTLRSLPASLQFTSLKAGEYGLGRGIVSFQFESGDTLLVEKGRFKWCGGTVHALAMRLPLQGGAFAADLYCDRLNLAELLRQFGIKEAGGNGTVNGHIPLSFAKGKFLFEDGFLYSTPGGGGNIRVKALDMLTAGVPKNSPQFAQLDFASAALSNFTYNWVKLSLVSEGDDVVLKMNLDGRPARPLPFFYDQKSGTFNRLKVSSEKGIDQPIVLDVNFRIPFNELLGYGKSIKQVIDLMQ